MIKIGLASIRHQESISKGLNKIGEMLLRCREQNVDIVCFPEAYLPGLRGTDVQLPPPDQQVMEQALLSLQSLCKRYATMAIVGMEWVTEIGLHNRAYVLSEIGEVLGYQTKNQLPPGGESEHYVPDGSRMMFSVKASRSGSRFVTKRGGIPKPFDGRRREERKSCFSRNGRVDIRAACR